MNPETFTILIAVAGLFIGALIGGLGVALAAAGKDKRAYRRGRTDMEKLIRDQSVRDLRDSTRLF